MQDLSPALVFGTDTSALAKRSIKRNGALSSGDINAMSSSLEYYLDKSSQ